MKKNNIIMDVVTKGAYPGPGIPGHMLAKLWVTYGKHRYRVNCGLKGYTSSPVNIN